MKKIFVTGSGGFLGSYIAQEFLSQSWDVTGIQKSVPGSNLEKSRNITYCQTTITSPDFSNLLQQEQPDLIVHAAGPSSVSGSAINPRDDFLGSVHLTFELLENIRNVSPDTQVIYLSSAAVYGNPDCLPIKESAKIQPLSPYGYHKSICEKLIEEYFTAYGIKGCSTRIFSAYGPGQKKMVLWDICKKALHEPRINLFGTGRESRDFIFASDLARCIRLIACRGHFAAEVYNIGNGQGVTICTIAEKLVNALDLKKDIVFNGNVRNGDPIEWRADISKIKSLGYSPEVSLDEGIKQYADWVRMVES